MAESGNRIFFVSSGRTGTLFLKEFFDQYVNECASFHEPKPAFKRRGFDLVTREATLYEKLYFKSFREFWFWRAGGRHYVEANYCLFSAISLVRELYPEAEIVHVIRDGRDVVKSYLNAGLRYINNESDLKPAHFNGDPYREKWDSMTPFQKTAWFWLRTNEVIERANPDRTIFFEDLFSKPHEPMWELLDLFPETELSEKQMQNAFQKKEHSTEAKFIPDWEEWPGH